MDTTVSNRLSGMGMLSCIPIVLALAFPQNAPAAPSVSIGEVSYLGTGCNSGEGDSISGSGLIRTLNFKRFDAGVSAVSGLARSACNVVISAHLPSGYQISLTASFRGSVKGNARLTRSYGTSIAPNGALLTSNLTSVRGKRFSQNDAGNGAWSTCGASAMNLRLNSSVQAIGSASKISVDKMTVRIAVRPCH